jgi:tetrahydromethanopterin S-methyltransferase subunit C
MASEEQYEQVLRDALEDVFVIAVRQGLDTGQLAAEFDADRGPGSHQEHTLTISVRDTAVTVMAHGIPRECQVAIDSFVRG